MQDSGLNVLIYPMLSVDTVNSDSNYVIYKKIIEQTHNEINYVLLLNKRLKYYSDGLQSKCKIISIDLPTAKKEAVVSFSPLLMKRILEKYPCEIIWNNSVEIGHLLKFLVDAVDDMNRPKVFNYHHYVIHPSLGGLAARYHNMKHVKLMQLIGSIGADVNYFHTKHCMNMLIDEAKRCLSDEMTNDIFKKSICHVGSYVAAAKKNSNKYDKFTFIYNHRVDGYKNYDVTFAIFDELHKKHDFQVIVTGGDTANLNTVFKKPYVVIKNFKNHDQYLNEISRGHCNVTNSQHETFCIALEESMNEDHVIVAPRAVTFPELLGEDYKYLFESTDQQLKMLDEILTNDIRQHKHKITGIDAHAEYIKQQFLKLCENDRNILDTIKDTRKRKRISTLLHRNSFRFNDLVKQIRASDLSSQSFSVIKIAKMIRQQGFKTKDFITWHKA